ncbi:MAG: Fe-S cluster protein [Rhodopirellula sp.]|nr:Fe-S cluster protein [Rhodopirellula sp.]
MAQSTNIQLPGLNCGLCGYRTCEEFQNRLASSPELRGRCIHLSRNGAPSGASVARADVAAAHPARRKPAANERAARALPLQAATGPGNLAAACGGCSADRTATACTSQMVLEAGPPGSSQQPVWSDHLGREFDFFLEHFPEDPGPREIILPHNPLLTRELDIQRGDILIGRPLGMSCGCPITHCGVVMEVDHRTGVIVWCVTGPLGPRQKGFKDLGYYIAEAYEGLVKQSRRELKLGMRYFFQPQMCMLQWRHSGLINYVSRNADGYQIRIEGLWIG